MGVETHARVKAILADALDRPPGERETYVRSRTDDPALVAEVVGLLRQYTESATPGLLVPGSDSADDDRLIGLQIEQYRIVDRIGDGGQGRVYLARDVGLHRRIALKEVLAGSAGAEERANVLREARAAAQVSHPNVATIHHVVEKDGRSFIVMEFVEGESLAAVFRRGRLPMSTVFSIGRQLAGAVAAAHAKGVIHRDLKPGNIHLLPDGTIKVLDFGIAGVTAAATTMTMTNSVAAEASFEGQPGTPGYMAPEQVTSTHYDERSDIFSLGVVLFELATGQRAYGDRRPEKLKAAASQPLPRADRVSPDVPAALADVLATAVEVDPARRFSNAQLLGRALEQAEGVERSMPVERRVRSRPNAAARFWRAAEVLVPVAALTFIAIGWLNSRTFNLHLERTAYANETWVDAMKFGAQSLVAPFAMLAALVGAVAVTIVVRNLVVRFSSRARATEATLTDTLRTASHRLALDETPQIASMLLLLCVVSLCGAWWAFAPFIQVMFSKITEATPEALVLLSPAKGEYQQNYRKVFSAITIGSIAAWIYMGRRLLYTGGLTNRLLLAGGVTVSVMALGTLQLPYRFMLTRARFPIVTYNKADCYRLGSNAQYVQLLCPSDPHRIVLVRQPAADVTPTTREGNIFEFYGPPVTPAR